MYNVVFPCVMMSALTLLVFCLPPDSGEKIALGITVLLAFSVFMLAVAENLPETSEFVPLISQWLQAVWPLLLVVSALFPLSASWSECLSVCQSSCLFACSFVCVISPLPVSLSVCLLTYVCVWCACMYVGKGGMGGRGLVSTFCC